MTRPTAPKDRAAILAEMAARRQALDALDAAALVDVSGPKEQIADAERSVLRLLRRIADEERQVRDARALAQEARRAIRSELGRFVAAGAPAANVAALHGVPASWAEPRGDDPDEEDDDGARLGTPATGESWAAPEVARPGTADLYGVAVTEPDEAPEADR